MTTDTIGDLFMLMVSHNWTDSTEGHKEFH